MEYTNDVVVLFTKGMKKFEVPETDIDLDVIRLCTYSPAYLNKQVIELLWHGGVGHSVFIDI